MLLESGRCSAPAAEDLPPSPVPSAPRVVLLADPAQRRHLDALPVRHAAVALAVLDLAVRVAVDVVAQLVVVVEFLAHGGGGKPDVCEACE